MLRFQVTDNLTVPRGNKITYGLIELAYSAL